MTNQFRSRLRGATTFAAIAAALALAGCNPSGSVDRSQSASLPALPATLPLAAGGATAPAYAPAAALLPAATPIRTVRVADPGDSYAYADDAWGFADALGDAPPDYGFYYDDVQPWAWQGYDDSIEFVEPLGDGYRYYYYRPGADAPYFVRDPDYGYGYDNGQLAVVYGPGGALIPYADYGPRVDYASRYYARGRDLYRASRQRRPVIAANWAARQSAIVDTQRWATARASQRAWQDYHQRTEAQQTQHWREEQARRRADTVRFTAWQGQDFRTPPPPRAIPAAWTKARWAQDQRRFAPPAAGFNGDAAARERAATQERARVARDAREPGRPAPGAFVAGPGMQRQQPQPQDRRADFARQQAEHAQQARGLAGQQQAVQQRQQQNAAQQQREQALHQQQAQASQQAAARDAQLRARQQADRAAGEQARQRQAQAQRAQADLQQRRQAQSRQSQEQVQQRQAAQAQQRAQGQARAQEQAAQAQQRQAAQAQQRGQMQAIAQQRQAAQAQQRQAAQAQQRAEAQVRQRPASPPPHPAQVAHPQPAAPAAPRVNPGNGGDHKREPH